jgi:hypothetical protein
MTRILDRYVYKEMGPPFLIGVGVFKERTFSAAFSQFVIYVDELSASQVRLKGLLVSDERNPE